MGKKGNGFLKEDTMGPTKSIQSFFVPQDDWPLKTLVQFKQQRQIQALWVGILAFLLPIFLYYGNRTSGCFRDSISHSYYIPFWGDVFVATTCSVGLFLMFYRGQSKPERALAVLGGICAMVVALNPTNGSGCDDIIAHSGIFFENSGDAIVSTAFPPLDDITGIIHLRAAVLLFVVLAIFNLFVFTATDKNNDYQAKQDNRNKLIRNWIYTICGVLMVITIGTLAYGLTADFDSCDAFSKTEGIFGPVPACEPGFWDRNNLTFYGEWAGLALFGIAWFVKGRGGGFLFLDETPNQIISRPWWWKFS
ncbi:MAG: hypothetical protein ABJR46_16520 [Tateyamaria sp.]|uniref:hypothetical protein n=1 Tax=Tateyamaria sp. TaxID=1929288 RepID=UPI00329A954E